MRMRASACETSRWATLPPSGPRRASAQRWGEDRWSWDRAQPSASCSTRSLYSAVNRRRLSVVSRSGLPGMSACILTVWSPRLPNGRVPLSALLGFIGSPSVCRPPSAFRSDITSGPRPPQGGSRSIADGLSMALLELPRKADAGRGGRRPYALFGLNVVVGAGSQSPTRGVAATICSDQSRSPSVPPSAGPVFRI